MEKEQKLSELIFHFHNLMHKSPPVVAYIYLNQTS